MKAADEEGEQGMEKEEEAEDGGEEEDLENEV
jgi:hypothetical protein